MKKDNFSNRQLFLLTSLKEEDYSTSQELANILNVSIRTVKNEISILRNKIDSDLIFIQSTPGYGYKIIIKDKHYYYSLTESIQGINLRNIQKFSKDSFNRVIFIIRKLLVSEKYIKVNKFTTQLFVSHSTVENDIIEVRKLLKKYNIYVISKPKYGIKIKGSEFDIRRSISEYYFKHPISELPILENEEKNMIQEIESIIIKKSKKNNLILSEFSIKNIAIHIYISTIRFNSGFDINDSKRKTIERVSNKSIMTAKDIYSVLRTELDVKTSAEEIDYLALHLDSKQIIKNQTDPISKDKKVITEIIKEIQRNFDIDFSSDKILVKFLEQHIPQMIRRVQRGLVVRNPLLQENMRKYLFALKITESVSDILEKSYKVEIPLDEFGYLMLYFQNALNNMKKNRKILIGFIMGRGRADSLVYEQELRNKLPIEEFHIVTFSNWKEAEDYKEKVDIVVSVYSNPIAEFKYTVNIESGNYIEKIKKYAHKIKIGEVEVDKYFKPEFFVSDLKGKSKDEVYTNILKILQKEKVVDQDINIKEPFVSKELGDEIVHLQDLYKICRLPVAFIGILEEPMLWNKSMVNIIFLIKTKRDGDKNLPIICQLFSDFISDSSKVINLKEQKDYLYFKTNLMNA